jgi:hypothetical protein
LRDRRRPPTRFSSTDLPIDTSLSASASISASARTSHVSPAAPC